MTTPPMNTGLRDGSYADVRSETSKQPLRYLTDFVPTGTCAASKGLSYTCKFSEGGERIAPDVIRLGVGLTRQRGATRVNTPLVGPSAYHYGSVPWTHFQITDKTKHRYEYAIQPTATRQTSIAPDAPQHVEPFQQGGESTRTARDMTCTW